jgi:hypothetical protein
MMNVIKHLRLAGLMTSVAAVGILGIPATASAGKSHFVSPYKVEKHVDIEGEDGTYDLSCKASTDIAVDGMWRVDDIAQDNDWQDPDPELAAHWSAVASTLTILKSLRPVRMEADSTDRSTYHFKFIPLAGGDTQMKLWITCMPSPFGGSGHTHTWTTGTQQSQAAPVTNPVAYGTHGVTAAQCGAKQMLIQPGFNVDPIGMPDLVESMPKDNAGVWDKRSWTWTFFSTSAVAGTVTWRCLDLKSSTPTPAGTHTHSVVVNRKRTTFPLGLSAKAVRERQQDCGEHYKALVGGFDLTKSFNADVPFSAGPPVVDHVPAHMGAYFLGMDPRIKTRAFKFVNLESTAYDVDVAAVCFKDRTT